MTKEQIRKYCAAGMALLMFALIVIRAATMTITFDEAYTYFGCALDLKLNFQGIKELYLTSNSNNHILNTILIAVMDYITHARYVEWLIRFPNIAAAAVYMYVLYKMYMGRHICAAVYYILISGYYVNEFFSLARGYGLAVCFITICLCLYQIWKESGFEKIIYPCFIMIFYMLACMSNTICLLLAPALGLFCVVRLIIHKKIVRFLLCFWYGILMTGAGIIAMLAYHFRVTAEGNDVLYVVNSKSFFEAFFVNFGRMIFGGDGVSTVIAIVIFSCSVLGCLLFAYQMITKKTAYKPEYILIFLSVALLIFAEGKIKGGDFATGRAMIPLFPVMVFVLQDILQYIKKPAVKRGLTLTGSLLILGLSVIQWDVTTTREFPSDPEARAYGYHAQYEEIEEYQGFNITIAYFYAEQAKYVRSFE